MRSLDNETEYTFDSALVLGDISPDAEIFFRFFHNDPNSFTHNLCRQFPPNDYRRWKEAFFQRTLASYLKWRRRAAIKDRMLCSRVGWAMLVPFAYEAAADITMWLTHKFAEKEEFVNDSIVIPGFTDYKYSYTKKTMRRLNSVSFVKRQMMRHRMYCHLASIAQGVTERLQQDSKEYQGTLTEINEYRQQLQEQYRQAQLCANATTYDEVLDRLVPRNVFRAVRKPIRKAAAKSVAFLEDFVGKETTRQFLRGEGIVIQGKQFNFKVYKGSIFDVGHGGLKIDLQKPDGQPLGSLCFYFDSTPAAEQLAALKMYVDSGFEHEIVESGNLRLASDETWEYTPLGAIKQKPVSRIKRVCSSKTDDEKYVYETVRARVCQAIGDVLRLNIRPPCYGEVSSMADIGMYV